MRRGQVDQRREGVRSRRALAEAAVQSGRREPEPSVRGCYRCARALCRRGRRCCCCSDAALPHGHERGAGAERAGWRRAPEVVTCRNMAAPYQLLPTIVLRYGCLLCYGCFGSSSNVFYNPAGSNTSADTSYLSICRTTPVVPFTPGPTPTPGSFGCCLPGAPARTQRSRALFAAPACRRRGRVRCWRRWLGPRLAPYARRAARTCQGGSLYGAGLHPLAAPAVRGSIGSTVPWIMQRWRPH